MSRQAFAMVPYAAIVDRRLSAGDIRALAIIAARRDFKTHLCEWPLPYLARLVGYEGERAGEVFGRTVKKLHELGYVRYEPGQGKRKSRIRVIMDATPFPEGADSTDEPDPVEEDETPPEEWEPPHYGSGGKPHRGSGDKSDTTSDTKNRTPKPPEGADADADALFDEFWAAYPNKKGKDAARRAFAKRKPTGELLAAMLAAIEKQKRTEDWRKEKGRYIPHPATWLNQGRWQDELGVDLSPAKPLQFYDPRYFAPNKPDTVALLPQPRPGSREHAAWVRAVDSGFRTSPPAKSEGFAPRLPNGEG